jgi:hypothetical protein
MSRQVSKTMATALMSRKNKKSGSSEVVHDKVLGSTTMYLHHHAIAHLDSDNVLTIRSAGWETNTTKDRLNALPGVRINQKDYQWYLNGEIWKNSSEWTEVK